MDLISKLNRINKDKNKMISDLKSGADLQLSNKLSKWSRQLYEYNELEFRVNFYDYDGTVLYSYLNYEFLELAEMPPLPTQLGMICQGWNWNLEDAQEYVSKYSNLNIGAIYTTDDGKTRFYIDLPEDNTSIDFIFSFVFSQEWQSGTIVDWGDGTSNTVSTNNDEVSLSHTYSTKGEYMISLFVPDGNTVKLGIWGSKKNMLNDERLYLKKVNIGENIYSTNDYAFSYCTSLQSITIPNGIRYLSDYAFRCCHSLQNINIPTSVDLDYISIFSSCTSLRSITIPNATRIASGTFGNCISLQSITIPDSVTTIDSAFRNCYSLQSITIPDSVTYISSAAFYNCSDLKNIVIWDSVTSISYNAFQYCSSLQSITIPNGVTNICNDCFNGCFMLKIIDFTTYTSIPTLETNALRNTPLDFEIRVPIALYDDWCNATNWSNYKDNIKHGLMDATDITYNSLSITADDVGGKKTNTTIYYTINATGTNKWTGTIETYDIMGTAISDSFPQNTSTTDTVERTITFELGGLTATTTITQGIWKPTSYTIDLNGQWQLSSKPNPDSSLYDGVYESFSNYNVNSGYATMYIDMVGYETFKLYIRSYAESNYDYVMVSQLDQNITGSTSYSDTTLVKAHTRGKQQSGTALSNYTLVEFTGIDGGDHRITIVYRKDSSGNSADDRGYIFVEN